MLLVISLHVNISCHVCAWGHGTEMAGRKMPPAGGQGRITPDHNRPKTWEDSAQLASIRWPCSTPKKHHKTPYTVKSTSWKNNPFPVDFFFVHRFFRCSLVQSCSVFQCFPQSWRAKIRNGTQQNSHSQQPCLSGAGARMCKVFLYDQATIRQQPSNNLQACLNLFNNVSNVSLFLLRFHKMSCSFRGRRSILEISVVI